jgi:hypothetical protein
MRAGGSMRQVRLGNVEAAHKNKIIAMGRTTSSLNSEIMTRLRPSIGSGHDAIVMVNASLMAKPFHRGGFTRPCYRADRNAIASTMTHPTMTREATAPAVILSFSLAV